MGGGWSAMRDDDRPAGKRAVEKPVRRARAAGGNGDARPARPVRRRAVVGTSRLRSEYGLTRQTVARMVGVSEGTVARWEEGKGRPGDATARRVRRVEGVLKGLAQVMRRGFIPTWLEQPNN